MKRIGVKTKLFLVLLFAITNISLWANEILLDSFLQVGENRIVILHPTASNIRHFEYLMENGIIDSREAEVIGVYYKNEVYDFIIAEKYIKDHDLEDLGAHMHISRILVNSKHHQCIKKLGQQLQVEAVSLDGRVIQAISHKRYPNVIGLQFHPEDSEIYRINNPYVIAGSNKPVLLRKELKKDESLDFHLLLWKRMFRNI